MPANLQEKPNWAVFSPNRIWRYTLLRTWGSDPANCVVFIGLNPSTADETTDDPTIRRCIGFAKAWSFDRLVMLNLFAFRATDPQVMKAAADPVGPMNNKWIIYHAKRARRVVAAWGVHGEHQERGAKLAQLLAGHGVQLECLGKTKAGHPKHPLYLAATTPLEPFALQFADPEEIKSLKKSLRRILGLET